jgi:hypothetical protein
MVFRGGFQHLPSILRQAQDEDFDLALTLSPSKGEGQTL